MNGTKVYPMTFEQESVWLDEHLSGEPSRYLEAWAYRLRGAVDADAVEWALRRIVDRHECLRSRLTMLDEQLVQVVEPVHETTLEHLDLLGNDLDEELRQLAQRPLDLNVSPLRAGQVHLSPTDSVLLVQFHHAVVDRWSFEILDAEFTRWYSARVAGRPEEPTPVPPQLGEYALAQRAADVDRVAVDYWRDRLREVPVPKAPLADRPPPAVPTSRSGDHRFKVMPELGQRIQGLARAARTTPFTVFTAALAALSCGYTGMDETVIGTPVSRRWNDDLDGMIGCLTDLVPLRCPAPARREFAGLVADTRTVVLGAMTHGTNLSYSQIMARSGVRRRLRSAPLCPTVLGLDDDRAARLDLPGVTAERIEVYSRGKGALQLNLTVEGGGYDAVLEYDHDRYDPPTVGRIAEDICAVLDTAVAHPDWETAKILSSNGVH